MKPLPLLLAGLLAAGLLAGCTTPADDAGTPPPAAPAYTLGPCLPQEQAIPQGNHHNHSVPAQHRAACGAELLGHDTLREFGWTEGSVVGAHAVDVAGDLLAVGVNAGETDAGQQGFHLFGVANGTLEHLSYYDAGKAVGGDRTIAFSDDGTTVYLGGETDAQNGVAAIDVTDPLHPKQRAYWDDPQNFGSHTVAAGTIDGQRYVFSLALGINILRDDGDSFTLVGKYLTADQLAVLDAPASQTGPETYALRSLYGHDMTFYSDPEEGGRSLLFVAYAYDGFKVVDVTVPSAPTTIGRWMPPADTAHKHYTHSVEVERQPGGQLLVVVGAETFEPENQGIASPLWVLDATATVGGPAGTGLPGLGPDPVLLGTWRNPSGAPAGNLGLSVHFFRLEGGLLYVSHYHGGIWAIDLRTAEAQKAPKAFGYAMPVLEDAVAPPEECCIGFDLNGAPMVFDVAVRQGVVYSADESQGVAAIRFTAPPL